MHAFEKSGILPPPINKEINMKVAKAMKEKNRLAGEIE